MIGKRQATLVKRLADPKTRWRRLLVTGWYGRGERLVEIVSGTALWHHPGRLVPIRYVLVRDVAGELRPQAFLCTDPANSEGIARDVDAVDILRWFVRRWSIEVTFAEVRRHLGVETQRHREAIRHQGRKREGACEGSDPALARTTPALLRLFSLVTLWAHNLHATQTPASRAASWYSKPLPTFSDALARVRRELWTHHDFHTSPATPDLVKLPRTTIDALIGAACYAA